MTAVAKLLKFPVRRAPTFGASKWDVWKSRAIEAWGRLLNRAGAPGAVKDVKIKDSLTGQEIQISVGVLFTKISVNGRDFYFSRTSGKYDGTGSGT